MAALPLPRSNDLPPIWSSLYLCPYALDPPSSLIVARVDSVIADLAQGIFIFATLKLLLHVDRLLSWYHMDEQTLPSSGMGVVHSDVGQPTHPYPHKGPTNTEIPLNIHFWTNSLLYSFQHKQ